MRTFYAVLLGIIFGIAAVFLHSFFPPLGIIIAILGSATGIWSIGRVWGKRRFKIIASILWIAIVIRASAAGVGQEFLIQGDGLGLSLLNFGLIAILVAIALPI